MSQVTMDFALLGPEGSQTLDPTDPYCFGDLGVRVLKFWGV